MLKPGERVPSETVLVDSLGVSRSTVREAVKQLVSNNIFEIHRGDGTYVCHDVGVGKDPFGFQFVSDKKKLALDLCDIRSVIEPWIVKRAAENAAENDILKMKQLCLEIEAKIRKGENHAVPDIELHKLWAQCTGNSVVPNLIPILMQAIPLFIDVTHQSLQKATIETHRRIVDAIALRDGESAAEAMLDHIVANRTVIEKSDI